MIKVYHLTRSHRTFLYLDTDGEVKGTKAGLYQVQLSKKSGLIRLLKIDPETGSWYWLQSIAARCLPVEYRNKLLHYLHQKGMTMNINTDETGTYRLTDTQKFVLANLRNTLKEQGETIDDLIDAVAFALLKHNSVITVTPEIAIACAENIVKQSCENWVFCMAQRVVERMDNGPQWEADLSKVLASPRHQPLIITDTAGPGYHTPN